MLLYTADDQNAVAVVVVVIDVVIMRNKIDGERFSVSVMKHSASL